MHTNVLFSTQYNHRPPILSIVYVALGTMSRFMAVFSFLSLLILAYPLGATAQSSSYNPLTRWKTLGCYNETLFHEDGAGYRALYDGPSESLPTMTRRMCITFCDSNDYPFAGTESGQYVTCLIPLILQKLIPQIANATAHSIFSISAKR